MDTKAQIEALMERNLSSKKAELDKVTDTAEIKSIDKINNQIDWYKAKIELSDLCEILDVKLNEKIKGFMKLLKDRDNELIEIINKLSSDADEIEKLPFNGENAKKEDIKKLRQFKNDWMQFLSVIDKSLEIDEASEKTKENAKAFPQLQSSGVPKKYTMPIPLLFNNLNEFIDKGAIKIPVLSVGKPNEVTILADVKLDNMKGVTFIGKPFTEYDKAVHNAVVSLYMSCIENEQPPILTADMVYRTITHKTNDEYVSPQQREAVTKSIEKMCSNIFVHADVSEEMRRRKVLYEGKLVDKYVMNGFLITATKRLIEAGGKVVDAYIIHELIILQYALLTGQYITANGDMLNIKKIDNKGNITPVEISYSINRIAVREYLLRRVRIMRNDEKNARDALRKYEKKREKDPTLKQKNISEFRKQTRVILFDSLFKATDIVPKTQTNIKEYVYRVLNYWEARGDIKGYTKRKKGKKIDAIIIHI